MNHLSFDEFSKILNVDSVHVRRIDKKKAAKAILIGAVAGTVLSPLMIRGELAHPDSLYAKLFK